jgi:hypothetical protein
VFAVVSAEALATVHQIEAALQRAPLRERQDKRKLKRKLEEPVEQLGMVAEVPRPRKVAGKQREKQRLVRAVALGSLTATSKAQAIAKAQAVGKVEEILDPPPAWAVDQAKLMRDGCSGDVVFVVYDEVSGEGYLAERRQCQQRRYSCHQAQPVSGSAGEDGNESCGKPAWPAG